MINLSKRFSWKGFDAVPQHCCQRYGFLEATELIPFREKILQLLQSYLPDSQCLPVPRGTQGLFLETMLGILAKLFPLDYHGAD